MSQITLEEEQCTAPWYPKKWGEFRLPWIDGWNDAGTYAGAETSFYYYSINCLICHKGREHRTYRRDWEHFICPECRGRMLADGIFIIEAIHDIIYHLSNRQYPEEEFFMRLDHILKTLKIDHFILDYRFHFDHSVGTNVIPYFHIEIILNDPTRDLRAIGVRESLEPVGVLRTQYFSVKNCCVLSPPPKVTKREYLPKEHFKWEDCDGQQI